MTTGHRQRQVDIAKVFKWYLCESSLLTNKHQREAITVMSEYLTSPLSGVVVLGSTAKDHRILHKALTSRHLQAIVHDDK